MPQFEFLWEKGPLFAQAEHFKLGTDTVLLADFANVAAAKQGIDLGCASGAIGLLLLSRTEKLHMSGLEIIPEAAELARANMAANGLEERSEIICGDIREHRSLFRSGSFDLVLSNPPYFPVERGYQSPDAGRAGARGEAFCSMEDICKAAAFLLKTGGSFCIVHKPERLSELCCCLTRHGLEPKRLRMVCHKANSAPNLLLLEARRGGRPGLKIEPCLVIRNADDSESDEIKAIYHR